MRVVITPVPLSGKGFPVRDLTPGTCFQLIRHTGLIYMKIHDRANSRWGYVSFATSETFFTDLEDREAFPVHDAVITVTL